jgi:hypothetical protein
METDMRIASTTVLFACAALALPAVALADAGRHVKPTGAPGHMPTACSPMVVDANGAVHGTGTNHARPCKPVAASGVKPCKPMVVDAAGRTQGVNTSHVRPCRTADAQ